MTTIGLAGAGTIGSGLIALIGRSPAAKKLRIKTLLVRDAARVRNGLPAGVQVTTRLEDLTDDPEIQIVVELMGGVDAPLRVVTRALEHGKSVVSANKNLLAQHGPALFALAAKHRVNLGLEASVCGGIPVIRLIQEALRADHITALEGIVNGTTNYLLTRMSEEKTSYADALAEAQRLGFAEPDPDYDVSGKDAVCKAGILATLAFGGYVDFRRIPTSGIESLQLEDLRQAERMGYTIKLVATARRSSGSDRLDASVAPVLLPLTHPLASIRHENNAVLIESEGLGMTLASGKGAGPSPTSVSLLADLLDIAEGRQRVPDDRHPFVGKPFEMEVHGQTLSRYYLRFSVPDRPGILAQVAGRFAEQGLSIASVLQPEAHSAETPGTVALILTTHSSLRAQLDNVLEALSGEGWGTPVVLRIQED
ncbi:MAG: homoserine dehydrogenase [Spirochaetales bacterium]